MSHRRGASARGWAAALRYVVLGVAATAVASCGVDDPAAGPPAAASSPATSAPTPGPASALRPPSVLTPDATSTGTGAESSPSAEPGRPQRPAWLGTRVLPLRPDGLGEVQPTPAELVDRRLPPPDLRPAPDVFEATIEPVPDDVLERSTWTEDCPVALDELRYVTLTFWGFDDQPHLGEMIVHNSVTSGIADVFGRLYDARFPIEEMRVVAAHELDAPPTGDGNNTTAFVCRPSTGGSTWSEHAYGLAVDVNPFHNPYHRGDVVIPELASAYLDRDRDLPGMITAGDVVTEAFAAIGWGWGGGWSSSKDWMHFSQSGR
ncbi:MAG TPA: M15 family metallopeptidase [Jiangellaceae bacterium]|nr:M15 family metallopeptidase [Jiangellaceae bacterium]